MQDIVEACERLTNDHDIEVKALANTLAVPLVGEVGKTDVAGKLASDNVPSILQSGGGGSLRKVYRARVNVSLAEVFRHIELAIRRGRRGHRRRRVSAAVGS